MAKKNTWKKESRSGWRMVPLNLPEGMNMYREAQRLAAEGDRDATLSLRCCDETMDHFGVPRNQWESTGDVIMRLAMLLSLQPEGEKFTINPDDAALNAIFDLYEEYNRRLDAALR